MLQINRLMSMIPYSYAFKNLKMVMPFLGIAVGGALFMVIMRIANTKRNVTR